MDSIYNKIEPILRKIRKPSWYIGGEINSPIIDLNSNDFNFCMVYPDLYEIGQSNQAVRILCNCVNDIDGFKAQRAYLPEPATIDIFKKHSIPLFSLESFSPLKQFVAIGITVSHDLLATNILETIDFAGIDIHSSERKNDDPFIFGGGPMYCNPEPYYSFFDVITIGEGEDATINALKKLRDLKLSGFKRDEILHELAKMPSIYVPSLYDVDDNFNVTPKYNDIPKIISRAIYNHFADSDAHSNCIVPFAEIIHDRLNIEIQRGCSRGCRFCQAGIMYRPVRERNISNICNAVKKGIKQTGYDEVSLTSLSTTDHSQIKEILQELNSEYKDMGLRISIPSQRCDKFGFDMAKLIAGRKKGGLTFAIEAGTQRLRDVINKNVCEDDILLTIEQAFKEGWNRVKLYFMIGLPTETEDDVVEIAKLSERILSHARDSVDEKRRHGLHISISCAIFIPKAQTPFMGDGFIGLEEAFNKINMIRDNIKSKSISFSWHDTKTSLIEAYLSRSGREGANLIELAWKNGAHFDSWDEYFDFNAWKDAAQKLDIDIEMSASRIINIEKRMPWSHISMGVDKRFFIDERNKADLGIITPDCTFDKCINCGVCGNLKTNNIIQGKR